MRIFYKRPLSLILCIMLGAFVFFSFYESALIRILSIFIALLSFIISFIIPKSLNKNIILLRICSVCAIAAMMFSFVYFDLWFKAYDRYQGNVKIVGTVERVEKRSYSTRILIKTDSIDDTAFSSYNLTAYVDHELYYGYSVGSTVEFVGTIESSAGSDGSFDVQSYDFSNGISGAVYEVHDFKILDIGEPTFSHKLWSFRQTICRRLILCSDAYVGGLLSALLLGEKSYLPTGTSLDFSRIGISHILALSGMHLAILALGFSKLLAFFKLGKKPSTAITVIFTLIYMAVTGFSVSVVRAGVMLIVSSLLYLLSHSKDSMTSLFVSVSLICFLEPYSIFDLSLWLSAFATLGIVVMSEYQSKNYAEPSFLRWLATAMLSTVFAISATLFITISKFDGISLLSPISTLIFSILSEIFIYIGLLLLAVGSFLPLKFILSVFGYAIIDLAKFFSEFDWIYVSTNFIFIEIISIIFSLAFFGFFILNIRRKTAYVVSISTSLALILILSASLTYANQAKTEIIYLNQSNEQILLTDQNEICVVDIATYDTKSAYGTYNVLASQNITHIDKYVLTHYTYNLEESVSELTSSLMIKEIFLPLPKNQNEERIFLSIYSNIPKERTSVKIYQNEDVIFAGDIALVPLHRHEIGKQKRLFLTMLYNDDFYTYLNMDMLDGDTKNMALDVIAGSRAIIFGCHETGTEERKFTYKLSEPDTIVFSSKKIKIPMDIIEYYSNCDIYFSAEKVRLIR